MIPSIFIPHSPNTTRDTIVAPVAATSPKESTAVAIITVERIRFPSVRLNIPIQNFTPTDSSKITMDIWLNTIFCGFRIFPTEFLNRENPTWITKKATINAAIYSILPWPKG
jgi:hypothetical protein